MLAQVDSADGGNAPCPLILGYRQAGFALHWLRERSKAPVAEGWSTAPVASVDTLQATYRRGYNVGVRLGEPSNVAGGYLHALDIDIRIPEAADEAFAALRGLLGDIGPDTLPCVASGSGGASRHLYFVAGKPFYSRKLWTSGEKFRGRDGKWHYTAEIELFGTGKQVAMPPSIHPDTGKQYRWERPFDLDMVELGIAPTIPAERLSEIADPDIGTYEFENVEPLTFKPGQLQKELDELSEDRIDDYHDWITLGQALHHQFGGSRDGYDLWLLHSKRSEKFNEKEMPGKWRGFGRNQRRPVTMATIRQWVLDQRREQFEDAFDDLPDLDDETADADEGVTTDDTLADLLGGDVGDDGIDPLDRDVEDDPLDRDVELPWYSLLDYNTETGAIRPHLHNVTLLVKNDPRIKGVPEFNLFTQEIVQRGPIGLQSEKRKKAAKPAEQLRSDIWRVRDPKNGTLWDDSRDNDIRRVFEAPKSQGGYGIKITDRDLTAAVNNVAKENSFHPVQEYLEGLQWDGAKRIDRLFIDFLGAPDNAYSRDIARLMLIAAVTRVFEPGHKFDFAVIIEGMQGRGKSTFIKILGRDWFAELDGNFGDTKQMVELMQGSWIMEIPELSGFTRADVRSIKAFISRSHDRARLAYARRAGEFPRQCIFIGSTNDKKYLKDETGARRFWPVHCTCTSIDFAGLQAVVDQIWAEALCEYRYMRSARPHGTLALYLTEEASNEIAADLQLSRTVESAEAIMAGTIEAWLDQPIVTGGLGDREGPIRRETCLAEIWEECLGKRRGDYKQADAQTLGRAMDLIPGWQQRGQLSKGKYGRQRAYRRVFSVTP